MNESAELPVEQKPFYTLTEISALLGDLHVTFTHAQEHIVESPSLSLNSDLSPHGLTRV